MTASDSLDYTLLALADPTLRAILRRLATSDARVSDVAAPFDISLNSVSKHIKALERAGLVDRRKQGREYILRFRSEPLTEVDRWISDQRRFWQAGLEAIDQMLRRQRREEK